MLTACATSRRRSAPRRRCESCSLDVARGRGARRRRRERLRQEHAREDPRRRPPPGRGQSESPARPRARPALAAQRASRVASRRSSRRSSSPSRGRCSTTSGLAPIACSVRRRHARREDAPRAARLWPSCSARLRRLGAVRSRSCRSAPGRPAASRARSCASPRILILDEATSALDVATRDRLFAIVDRPRRTGSQRDLHLASHGRDRGDRRPHHGPALGRERRDARRASSQRRRAARAADDRQRRISPAPVASAGRRTSVRRRRCCSAHELRLRRDGRGRSTSSCARGEIVGRRRASRATARTRSSRRCAASRVTRRAGRSALLGRRGGRRSARPRDAAQRGIAYVPRERRADALFETLSIRENFALPTVGADAPPGPGLAPADRRVASRAYIDQPADRARRAASDRDHHAQRRQPAEGRDGPLACGASRGSCCSTTRRAASTSAPSATSTRCSRRWRAEGVAIVMVSTELDEHVELMDRVLVFREQSLFAELDRARSSRARRSWPASSGRERQAMPDLRQLTVRHTFVFALPARARAARRERRRAARVRRPRELGR